ncbi:glycoside hydrolase [Thermotalea metallivorans]|uniref:Poly-beta-1,6-N-acetyl-D-glucosamine N-deacetylase n=1 Tax=Thermotalea metallivorans TaxID=520762 RepID=A0A140L8X9_9FIRM|nr:glycoside hydrolase [Thermotalea metallivorans]KXG77004.1 Poly-beta-1,6-N-acetyl-D-glucosamine N-deacetylase [Thermotalea metallivorans]
MSLLHLNKDQKKIFRSTLEIIVLIVLTVKVIQGLFVFAKYEPYDKHDLKILSEKDKGFIAISYLAVDRDGTAAMIGAKRLEEHLKALHDNGYVTITQEDIENYYKNGAPLPEKSLFLMFEDGRRDTAIFAQKIMENYNYIGTMLSYADKFDNRDMKFLSPEDLKHLEGSSFWELGTNGYRLSYINVFDRYHHYLGELSAVEYSRMRKYLGRNYNHYLMDYIRDEYQIPKESYSEMKERISNDYRRMEEIYTKKLGKIPRLYVLMHSNTSSYGSNKTVSKINREWMSKLFTMNFNREGNSYNNRECDIYDLTRMQPQAYWYTNHLLMRIADDTKAAIQFVWGNEKEKEYWELIRGAAEFRDSEIVLTSVPQGNGLLRLKDSKNYKNIKVSASMTGNKLGSQAIYLRADEDLKKYVCVNIQNNWLIIKENGEVLYSLDFNDFDEIEFQSVEENKREALWAEYAIYKEGKSFKNETNMEKQFKPSEKKARSVEEGAEKYIPTIEISEAGNRKVDITLSDNRLTVYIDNRKAIGDLLLSKRDGGYVYLESAWGAYGYSQRNIADDVYDGVFRDLLITDITDSDENNGDGYEKKTVLYDNRLHGLEKTEATIKKQWNDLINWFIKTF